MAMATQNEHKPEQDTAQAAAHYCRYAPDFEGAAREDRGASKKRSGHHKTGDGTE